MPAHIHHIYRLKNHVGINILGILDHSPKEIYDELSDVVHAYYERSGLYHGFLPFKAGKKEYVWNIFGADYLEQAQVREELFPQLDDDGNPIIINGERVYIDSRTIIDVSPQMVLTLRENRSKAVYSSKQQDLQGSYSHFPLDGTQFGFRMFFDAASAPSRQIQRQLSREERNKIWKYLTQEQNWSTTGRDFEDRDEAE